MIHVFIGTKAQLIKMAPIMRSLQDKGINYNFVFSGQHQETIKDLRDNFGIKEPDITLHKGEDITSITKMLLWSIKLVWFTLRQKKRVWKGDKHGVVLNHGDTFSTLLGSILAKLSGLKNAHIESGLRSFKLFHPFPEELTRLIVFRCSDYFFCPGSWAENNVLKYKGVKINTEANTLYDALQMIKDKKVDASLNIPSRDYAVVSLHRFENLYKAQHLNRIVGLLEKAAEKIPLLFILHKPTKNKLIETGLLTRLEQNPKIETRPRYDYLNFISLVNKAKFVITDGGSNQEECCYLGKPCLLFRHATERQEGLGENVVLSEFNEKIIIDFITNFDDFECEEVKFNHTPTEKIVHTLKDYH